MKRFLLIIVLSFFAVACMDSSDDDTTVTPEIKNPNTSPTTTIKSELDPTASLLEMAPTDGKLPADLMPPV